MGQADTRSHEAIEQVASRSTLDPVSAARRTLLLAFVSWMDQEDIPYVILSGYEGYPDHIASDIDFMVPQAQLRNVVEKLQSTKLAGAVLVQRLDHETSASYLVFAELIGSRLAFLHPDAAGDYRRGGRLLIRASKMLINRRRVAQGFWVPAPASEFEYYLVKRISKGRFEPEMIRRLGRLYFQDPAGCAAVLGAYLSRELAPAVAAALCREDYPWIVDRTPEMSMALRARPTAEGLSDRAQTVLREWMRRARRLLQPTGLVVAVLGPDGSGKTTVIEHLMQEFEPAFRQVRRFHLRPRWGRVPDGIPVAAPHAQLPRGVLASTAKVLMFLIDYWIGWFRFIQPLRIKSTLVLFDRYFHDMLSDPTRYRLPPGFRLPRWAAAAVPAPDVWLILQADPAEIVRRKGEIGLDQAKALNRAYCELAQELPGDVCFICTDGSLASSLTEASSKLHAVLHTRVARRLRTAQE